MRVLIQGPPEGTHVPREAHARTGLEELRLIHGHGLVEVDGGEPEFDELRTVRLHLGDAVLLPEEKPGGSVRGERANFTRLVLGCIEAKFCK